MSLSSQPLQGRWLRVVPLDASQVPGAVSNAIQIPGASGNEPPIAEMLADPSLGEAPFLVTFYATASRDPDGYIARFEWDFDGDGVYDLDTGGTPNAERLFDVPGIFHPTVRVTDNEGETNTATVAITAIDAGGAWHRTVVDPGPDAGESPSITSLYGKPIILYAGTPITSNKGAFAVSDDYRGLSWELMSDRDSPPGSTAFDGYRNVLLPFMGGLAAHTSGNDLDIGSWYWTESIDTLEERTWGVINIPSSSERFAQVAAGGTVWVASQRGFSGFQIDGIGGFQEGEGGNWSATFSFQVYLEPDPPSMPGDYPSLAIVNGLPAVSWYSPILGGVKYARALTEAGDEWSEPTVVSVGNGGFFTSLAEVGGNPAIAFYDWNLGDLLYVRALDPLGVSWGDPIVLDRKGDVGRNAQMHVIAGKPVIAYYDATRGDLKVVRSIDGNGSLWYPPMTVDSGGDVGSQFSFAVISNRPAVAYSDATNGFLKYAVLY